MKLFYRCHDQGHISTKSYGDGNRPSDETVASKRCDQCFAPTWCVAYQKTDLPNMQPILSWPPPEGEK